MPASSLFSWPNTSSALSSPLATASRTYSHVCHSVVSPQITVSTLPSRNALICQSPGTAPSTIATRRQVISCGPTTRNTGILSLSLKLAGQRCQRRRRKNGNVIVGAHVVFPSHRPHEAGADTVRPVHVPVVMEAPHRNAILVE